MALHTHGNLGNVLQPRQSAPISHAGPSPLGGGRSQTMDKFGTLLSDPRMKAFMLNMAANLLTQQGIATSMGRGLEGVGRFETTNRQMQIAREQEEYRRREAAKKGKGGGGGGKVDRAKLLAHRQKLFETYMENGDFETMEDAMDRATVQALADFGQPGALRSYMGLTPEDRAKSRGRWSDIDLAIGAGEAFGKGGGEGGGTEEGSTGGGTEGGTTTSPTAPQGLTDQTTPSITKPIWNFDPVDLLWPYGEIPAIPLPSAPGLGGVLDDKPKPNTSTKGRRNPWEK